MLDRHDGGAVLGEFGLGGEGHVDAGGEGDEGRDGRLAFVFMVAERARVEDA